MTNDLVAHNEGREIKLVNIIKDICEGVLKFFLADVSNVVSFTAANHTASGIKVVRMNQSYQTGPSKSLKVYPGDKVDMEVWTYYEGSSGWGSSSTGISTFITNVAAGFGGVSGGGGESGSIYTGVNSAITAAGMAGNQGDTRPSAYLNYILFDRDYKLLDIGWTPVPTSANMAKQLISIPTVNVKEQGYMLVYLSYEAASNSYVYFDDFKVTHTKTNVIQYNEYYPFGLQASTSWTRDGSSNNFLYNAGAELNNTSGIYETMFRGYDAALGRFMQVDPLADFDESTSPFAYAGNNPALFNDPYGAVTQAPPGVSQMGWDRLHKINDRNNPNYFSDWASSFRDEGTILISEEYNTRGAFVGYSIKINQPNIYYFSPTDGGMRLDKMIYNSLPFENMTNVEFYLNDQKFKPNSLRTLYGRDTRSSKLGNFSGVTNISDDDIAHIIGYSQYLFFDLYKNLAIEDVARQQSANGDLDFKNVAYRLLEIGRNELLQINGTVFNANEAGNYLWGMVLEFHGVLISPNYAADLVTRRTAGRPDELWEQRAISGGRDFGAALRNNLGQPLINRITEFRNQYRLGYRP